MDAKSDSSTRADARAPDSRTSLGEENLQELLERCIERYETAGESGVEEILSQHPEAAPVLRRRLATLIDRGLVDPSAEAPSMPERLGPYRIQRLLGRGGMGLVLLGRRDDLSRDVAIKLLPPGQIHLPGARERFRREVEAIARLRHPGIVGIVDVGEEQGLPWFAMEEVPGRSLSEILDDLKPIGVEHLEGASVAELLGSDSAFFNGSWPRVAARIVRAAAEAIHYAHSRGIIHRDLKPSNLMITPDGRVVVLDFGLATTDLATRLTRSGAQLGSLPYMAPEQLRGEIEAIDERTDVYGLGVTLLECLLLRNPFIAGDSEGTRARVLAGKFPDLQGENRAVSRDLETVCRTAMAENAVRRYADAAALAHDLAAVVDRRPVTARRLGLVYSLTRWSQRHPAGAVATVLAMLLFVVVPVVGFFVLAQKNRVLGAAVHDANHERQRAERHRDDAVRAFRRAGTVVGDAILALADGDMRWEPQLVDQRRHMLEVGLEASRGLAEASGGLPHLKLAEAESEWRMGRIEFELGNPDSAVERLERCLALTDDLVELGTERTLLRNVAFSTLCRVHRQVSRIDAAVATAALAAEEMRVAVKNHPEDLDLMRRWGRALQLRGECEFVSRDQVSGLASLEQARAIFDDLVTRHDDEECRRDIASCELAIGFATSTPGELLPDHAPFERAIAMNEALFKEHPEHWTYAAEAARAHRALGHDLLQRRRLAESLEHCRRATDLDALVSKRFPGDPELATMSVLSRWGLANCLDALDEHVEECAERALVVEGYAELLRRYPQQTGRRMNLGVTLRTWSSALFDLGHYEESVLAMARSVGHLKAVVAVAENPTIRENSVFMLDDSVADLSGILRQFDEEELVELSLDFLRRARQDTCLPADIDGLHAAVVEALRLAAAKGVKLEELGLEREVFDAIRDREDFKAWLKGHE
ncbi:MAG: serine/threonine protein kinase [Planctomycetes bacterium]|nr:serine/threonine protein kinase [Planctomycetota bacterium]